MSERLVCLLRDAFTAGADWGSRAHHYLDCDGPKPPSINEAFNNWRQSHTPTDSQPEPSETP